jgi:O-antigen/teichoic acid export membrane protein
MTTEVSKAPSVSGRSPEYTTENISVGDERRPDLGMLARGGALNLVGAVCTALFGFLLTLVVTRGLDQNAVGSFFESIALFHILMSVSQLGADTGLVRMIPRFRVHGRTGDIRKSLSFGLGPVAVAGSIVALAVFVYAPELSRVFTNDGGSEGLERLIRVLAPFTPVAATFLAVIAATRGFGTMIPSVLLDKIAKPLAQPVLAFAVLAAGLGPMAVVLAWVAPFAVGLPIALLWLGSLLRRWERKASTTDERPAPAPRGALFREFWRFTGPRGLASVFAVGIMWLGPLMVGALASTREAGIFAAAGRYLALGAFVQLAIIQVVGPKLSELLAGDHHDRAKTVYRTATSWVMVVAWPMFLTMAVFAPALLSLFGPGFLEGQSVLVILGLTMLVATGAGPVDVVLLMGGKSSWNLVNTVSAVALNIGLNLLLTPRIGIAGAAFAWSASILANNLLPLMQVRILFRFDPFGRRFAVVAVSALACFGAFALVARAIAGPTLTTLLVSGLVSSIAYAALLWRFRHVLELPELTRELAVGLGRRTKRSPGEARGE